MLNWTYDIFDFLFDLAKLFTPQEKVLLAECKVLNNFLESLLLFL